MSKAVTSYRAEHSAAILYAQHHHGTAEGRGYGRWEAWRQEHDVFVAYTPGTGSDRHVERAGTRWCGTVSLDRLAAFAW